MFMKHLDLEIVRSNAPGPADSGRGSRQPGELVE
jgi:hypothetical protein